MTSDLGSACIIPLQNTAVSSGTNVENIEATSSYSQSNLKINSTHQKAKVDGQQKLPVDFVNIASALLVKQKPSLAPVSHKLLMKSGEETFDSKPVLTPQPSLTLKNCFVRLETLTALEKQLPILYLNDSTSYIGQDLMTSSLRALPSSKTFCNNQNDIERIHKNNTPGLKQASQGMDYTHEKLHGSSFKKFKSEKYKYKQQKICEQNKSTFLSSCINTSKNSETKTKGTTRAAVLAFSQGKANKSDEPLCPEQKRIVSSHWTGCKLTVDLELLQDHEKRKNRKRSRAKVKLQIPSLNPTSSCPDGMNGNDYSYSGSSRELLPESKSDDDDMDRSNLKFVNQMPSFQDELHHNPKARAPNSNGPNDEIGILRNAASSGSHKLNGLIKILSPTIVEESNSKADGFICPSCPRVFLGKANLSKHLYSFHGTCPVTLSCSYCGHLAKTSRELLQHSTQLHNDNKPFKCPHKACCFSTAKRFEITKHLVVHSNEKTVKCQNCDMVFKTVHSLRSHLYSCYNFKLFICEVCGKAFNKKVSMKDHMATIHEGIKAYLCTYCGKRFSSRGNLKRHLRIHKNSFPYPCPFCICKFRHSNTLKSHVEKKHRI